MSLEEHQISVTRTARYVTLGDHHNNISQVWFVCHGYGQLAADFVKYFQVLDDGSRYIVAPEGLSRFYRVGFTGRIGASWMTREHRAGEIYDYVNYLDALYTHIFERIDRDAVTVHVLGFSQGVATAARWIANGNVHAEDLVLWAGMVPPEFENREGYRRLRALRLTLVNGKTDELIASEHFAEHRARLEKHGISARSVSFDGGHRLDKKTLSRIAAGS